jgi:hypothetical protein
MKLESCRTFKIHNNGRVHLLLYVFVTAPVFQLDTSELNADANANTRRVEVRVPQRKERPTHSQTTNSNGPKHKQNM